MATFEQLMDAFGVVTVMNACIYKLKPGISYVGRGSCVHGEKNGGALKPGDFVCTGLYLDTLKIANLTQEGPTKTITGGQYANPLLKYGKTMTMEMQDALGRAPVLVEFFGCDYEDGVLSVTDRFPGAFAIEGDSFFVDQKTGEKVPVHIFIPQFLPDAILTLTQDAEGDAAVFDLNGTVSVTKIRIDENPTGADIATGEEKNVKDVFYQIREKSWFHPNNDPEEIEKAPIEEGYHVQQLDVPVIYRGEDPNTPPVIPGQSSINIAKVENADGYILNISYEPSGQASQESFTNKVVTMENEGEIPGCSNSGIYEIKAMAISTNSKFMNSDWSQVYTEYME